jgi:hypothetical protein
MHDTYIISSVFGWVFGFLFFTLNYLKWWILAASAATFKTSGRAGKIFCIAWIAYVGFTTLYDFSRPKSDQEIQAMQTQAEEQIGDALQE